MIRVTVRVGGGIGGITRVESRNFIVPEGTSLAEFMEKIRFYFGDEVTHETVLVAVNGRAHREPERAALVLRDGDVVSAVRAFAGG